MTTISQETQSVNSREQQTHVTPFLKEEIDELASELADSYVEYFTIDISQYKKRSDDAIDECLSYLEEVSSVLESYKQNNANKTEKFIEKLASKNGSLLKLYEQVDAFEQYMFETNQLLNQLENTIKELEAMKKSRGNPVRQIIDKIPRISLSNMPRIGILQSISGFVNDSIPNHSEYSESEKASIQDILGRIKEIQASLDMVTSDINKRLSMYKTSTEIVSEEKQNQDNLDEQIDGSWQELL